MTGFSAIAAAIVSFFRELAKSLPLLAVWLAHRSGESSGIEKSKAAQTKLDAEVVQEYEEVSTQGITDEEVDKRLDEGTL